MNCAYCGDPILPEERDPDTSVSLHHECLFRMVTGSAAHILRECACFGGSRRDPPGMSKHEAARLALETFRAVHVESTRTGE